MISCMVYILVGSSPTRLAMSSGTLIWVKSTDPLRPPWGGAMQVLVAPKTNVIAISGWAKANRSRP